MAAELWAIVAELEEPGKWNVVGIATGTAILPCVSSEKENIERAWILVSHKVKTQKNARIAKFVEVKDDV